MISNAKIEQKNILESNTDQTIRDPENNTIRFILIDIIHTLKKRHTQFKDVFVDADKKAIGKVPREDFENLCRREGIRFRSGDIESLLPRYSDKRENIDYIHMDRDMIVLEPGYFAYENEGSKT